MTNGTNNKTVCARVNVILANLRAAGKPGAKRIHRNYVEQSTDVTLTQHTPDRFSIIMFDWKSDTGFKVMLINNKIEWISTCSPSGIESIGKDCIDRTDYYFDIIDKFQQAATPRGKLKAAMVTVRDYLQLHSKGSSGRVNRKLKWNHAAYRAWCTPGGGFMLVSISANARKEIFLKLDKSETRVSYEEYSKKHNCYMEFHDDDACNRSVKLLKVMFYSAFIDGKGLRVS